MENEMNFLFHTKLNKKKECLMKQTAKAAAQEFLFLLDIPFKYKKKSLRNRKKSRIEFLYGDIMGRILHILYDCWKMLKTRYFILEWIADKVR